jgi:hypothetical protein
MGTLTCQCKVFGYDDPEEVWDEELCTADVTQEDLLCDRCREFRQYLKAPDTIHGVLSHSTYGDSGPHRTTLDAPGLADGESRLTLSMPAR